MQGYSDTLISCDKDHILYQFSKLIEYEPAEEAITAGDVVGVFATLIVTSWVNLLVRTIGGFADGLFDWIKCAAKDGLSINPETDNYKRGKCLGDAVKLIFDTQI